MTRGISTPTEMQPQCASRHTPALARRDVTLENCHRLVREQLQLRPACRRCLIRLNRAPLYTALHRARDSSSSTQPRRREQSVTARADTASRLSYFEEANLQEHGVKHGRRLWTVRTLKRSARIQVAAATESVRTVARAQFLCAQSQIRRAESRATALRQRSAKRE